MKKSYWMGVSTHNDKTKQDVLSWFLPLCDGMTVESARILCDTRTDNEKKIEATLIDRDGQRMRATRSLGRSSFSISLKALAPASRGEANTTTKELTDG